MATYEQPKAENKVERSLLGERALRQAETYWKIRSAKSLEKLETEARKMLQLEEELGGFAIRYYEAVGAHAERLSMLEEQLAQFHEPSAELGSLQEVLAQKTLHASRRSELKKRYRMLAKEIHPDRAMMVRGEGQKANHMHTLNASYQKGDLAGLLRLEAELILEQMNHINEPDVQAMDRCLREIERAAETYAAGYRSLLNSPLNELMLRALQARLAGWNWLDAVVTRVQRNIEEKERALAIASIAAISQWREEASRVVA